MMYVAVPPVITSAGPQTKWMGPPAAVSPAPGHPGAVMEPMSCYIITSGGSAIIIGFLRYSSSTFDIIINIFISKKFEA